MFDKIQIDGFVLVVENLQNFVVELSRFTFFSSPFPLLTCQWTFESSSEVFMMMDVISDWRIKYGGILTCFHVTSCHVKRWLFKVLLVSVKGKNWRYHLRFIESKWRCFGIELHDLFFFLFIMSTICEYTFFGRCDITTWTGQPSKVQMSNYECEWGIIHLLCTLLPCSWSLLFGSDSLSLTLVWFRGVVMDYQQESRTVEQDKMERAAAVLEQRMD